MNSKIVFVIKYPSGHIKCVCEDFEQAKQYMKQGYESISTLLEKEDQLTQKEYDLLKETLL